MQHLHFWSYPVTRESNPVDWKSRNSFTVHGTPRQVVGVLVWSTKPVDDRPRVLHLGRWLDAQSLLHIGSCDEKMCGLDKQKLVAMATSLGRSPPNFTAIIYDRRATNPEYWTKIGRAHFEIIGLEWIIKTGILSRSLKWFYLTDHIRFPICFPINYMSISCHFGDRALQKLGGYSRQKLVAMATSPEGSKN